ncbi:ECF transporter S component [Haloimpatiens lingqiaonensis]|uniref:ECF transporter S component n=1 Tax=Haloimpatiens lingqiaonensis TaxID=1380675 RepID=UPI0010FEA07B|nr:ECF transporter S component [Haloimpatiens lingqiaonensis]
MKKVSALKLSIVGFGIALNIIGAFIALNLRLPIYLDSIGTILVAFVLGPAYGVATGLCGSIVSGITFDIYSLYFAPVQILVGLLSGLMFKKGFMKGIKMPLGVFAVSIFSSFVGAIIAAFVFDGITSSGSTYIVQLLSVLGVNKVISVFIVQLLTDYCDKFVAVSLVMPVILGLPRNIKEKCVRS